MKKISLILVMILLCVTSLSSAEVDLSGMSVDELLALKDQINLAIWNSKEWQEVTVPQGVWKVGEDIPVGHWTIKCSKEDSSTMITVGYGVSDDGKSVGRSNDPALSDIWYWKEIYGEKGYGDLKEWDYDMKYGLYVSVEHSAAVFYPYSGKPSLGFQ